MQDQEEVGEEEAQEECVEKAEVVRCPPGVVAQKRRGGVPGQRYAEVDTRALR